MSLTTRPQREDYFPKTRRGHGSMNAGRTDVYGTITKQQTFCVDPTCQLNAPKSKNQHVDTAANIREWCEERGLRLKHVEPFQAMVAATGGVR